MLTHIHMLVYTWWCWHICKGEVVRVETDQLGEEKEFQGTRLCPLRPVMLRIGFMTGLRLRGVTGRRVITVQCSTMVTWCDEGSVGGPGTAVRPVMPKPSQCGFGP
jgi:hypothetical protein